MLLRLDFLSLTASQHLRSNLVFQCCTWRRRSLHFQPFEPFLLQRTSFVIFKRHPYTSYVMHFSPSCLFRDVLVNRDRNFDSTFFGVCDIACLNPTCEWTSNFYSSAFWQGENQSGLGVLFWPCSHPHIVQENTTWVNQEYREALFPISQNEHM